MLILLERLEQTIYDAAIQDSVESLSPSSCSRCLPEFDHGERVVLVVKECLGSYPFRSLCPWGEGGGARLGLCWWTPNPPYCNVLHCFQPSNPLHNMLYCFEFYCIAPFGDIQSMGRSDEKNMKGNKGQMRAVSPNKVNLAASSGAHCCLGKPRWEPGCLSLFQ